MSGTAQLTALQGVSSACRPGSHDSLAPGSQDLAQAKVGNFGNQAAVVQQHIVGLAVEPDDALAVQIGQPTCDPQCNELAILVPASLPRRGVVIAYPLS
jgi:hypothetical protein